MTRMVMVQALVPEEQLQQSHNFTQPTQPQAFWAQPQYPQQYQPQYLQPQQPLPPVYVPVGGGNGDTEPPIYVPVFASRPIVIPAGTPEEIKRQILNQLVGSFPTAMIPNLASAHEKQR